MMSAWIRTERKLSPPESPMIERICPRCWSTSRREGCSCRYAMMSVGFSSLTPDWAVEQENRPMIFNHYFENTLTENKRMIDDGWISISKENTAISHDFQQIRHENYSIVIHRSNVPSAESWSCCLRPPLSLNPKSTSYHHQRLLL